MRALSPAELLRISYDLIPWEGPWAEAFDQPESSGVWFIWGQSGNGKSSFVMQLACELARHYKVYYDSLEEGTRKTLQDSLRRANMEGVGNNLQFGSDSMDELDARLAKRRAPQVAIIDSFQYTQLSFKAYLKLKQKHPDKLLIFISHARGRQPDGRTAMSVKYDADLKVFVEGFKAVSNGRYNPGGTYTIWEEGADKYWGEKQKVTEP